VQLGNSKGGKSDAVEARDCEATFTSPESSPPYPDDEAEQEMKRERDREQSYSPKDPTLARCMCGPGQPSWTLRPPSPVASPIIGFPLLVGRPSSGQSDSMKQTQ